MTSMQMGVITAESGQTSPAAVREYNYEHFRPQMFLKDLKPSTKQIGIHPGALAPDFELGDVDGRSWRLSELRGRPVILIFGSGS